MKTEVIGGIKNALERGYSIEAAVKSMISAGYNEQEVRAAADSIKNESVSSVMNPVKTSETEKQEIKKTSSTGKTVLISILIVLLVLIIGFAVLMIFFPNAVKDIFS